MIAHAYGSPPTRLQIDAAESRHGDVRAGFLLPRGCSAASSLAPAIGPPSEAVEQHGADGNVRPSPSAPEHVPAHEVRLIEPDGRVWWMVGK